MESSLFYRLGKLVYSGRWVLIVLWFILIFVCLPFLPHIISPFKTTGFVDENSQSAEIQSFLNKELDYNKFNRFIIMYSSNSPIDTPTNLSKIKNSLDQLRKFPIEYEVIYPHQNKKQISKDNHTAYAVVIFKSEVPMSNELLEKFKSSIKTPQNMTIHLGGEPIFVENVNEQTKIDLYKADLIAAPVSVITLMIVFGSIAAAMLPIILGGGCALMILTTLFFLGHGITLSIFTLNIALLLGLCLSLDYSLFIVSRFREELLKGLSIQQTIATTQATAGKAILFSGLAVFASLSALLLFPINILFSVAIGGLTAVVISVLTAIIFLPAILSVLKHRINWLPIKMFSRKTNRRSFWHWLAVKVVCHPWSIFFTILSFLLVLGLPFLWVKFGVSDFRIFPEHSEHRRFFDVYSEKFDEKELSPILLVVQTKHSTILSQENIAKLYNLAKRLKRNPLIEEVNSIVTTNEALTTDQYYTLYNLPGKFISPQVKQLLETTTSEHVTAMTIVSKYDSNSPQMDKLIDELRTLNPNHGISLGLTGTPISDADLLDRIGKTLPYVILWIMVFTYLILLILLRSIVLPIKAIAMNILSLFACYGALVLVFQEGYLHQLLNFEPQGMLDVSLVVIIFCALFGFSLDYEVFLLSRIKECYEQYGNTKKSVVFGIEKSSRIITSAAIIVIVLCATFLVADVLMVKAFGLGIAVAIFVDAFLIRTLLVPAIMTLLNQWNWYLPKWLGKYLPKL